MYFVCTYLCDLYQISTSLHKKTIRLSHGKKEENDKWFSMYVHIAYIMHKSECKKALLPSCTHFVYSVVFFQILHYLCIHSGMWIIECLSKKLGHHPLLNALLFKIPTIKHTCLISNYRRIYVSR